MRPVTGGMVPGVGIVGTAEYVPERGMRVVTNEEVHAVLRERGERTMAEDWLAAAGVERRRWTCVPGETAPDGSPTTDELLAGAAATALDDAGIGRSDVDLLIAATTTTSRLTTSMAAVAGGRLGVRCGAFEVRAGCASAAYAMALAYSQLAAGAECVVVTSAETLTKVAPRGGPIPYVAADGAAAVVLVRVDDPDRGLLGSWLCGDGAASALAGAPGELPPTLAELESDRYRLVADRRFDEAAAPWWAAGPPAVLAATGIDAGAVDAFVANQANTARIHGSAASAGLRDDAVVDVVAETANAGAASQLIALDRARRDGRAAPGRTVMLSAVGGGISAATLLLRP